VQVLGDASVGQFTRVMASITTWVAPKEGCNYCHNPNNMASDEKYTKVVARRMIQMTQHVNTDWMTHVAAVGVTCYTCHRGNNIPVNIWYNSVSTQPNGMVETNMGKNAPAPDEGLSSLPNDPFTPFLEQSGNIRIAATQALPGTDRQSIKQAEWTYALMMHFSQSLGVNCTYCHNSRSFSDWSQSTPQRATAWYGIRMVRDLNVNYLDPLHTVFPPYRLGASGDTAKVNCNTCHQGAFKPLLGVSMAQSFPELGGQPPPAK
jgi:photosynthetic reaction center cytochrome c subunit